MSVTVNTVLLVQISGPALFEFTKDVSLLLPNETKGLLTLLVKHTPASLLIQENVELEEHRDLDAILNVCCHQLTVLKYKSYVIPTRDRTICLRK